MIRFTFKRESSLKKGFWLRLRQKNKDFVYERY